MTLQEIEDAIVAQCELRRAEGWTIVSCFYGIMSNKKCCPLRSFFEDGWTISSILPPPLGMTREQAGSFINGVDANNGPQYSHDFYLLGVRVRERLGL